jgi:hypothetical protein
MDVAAEILRALADPERLAIAGTLARGPRTAASLATEAELPLERVHKHLRRLAAAGLVVPDDDRRAFRLDAGALREAARDVGPSRDAGLALAAANDEEETVLRAYFRGGVLRGIPSKESKRRIVLERIAIEFEPGRRYSEADVNDVVSRFHPDHAAVRRHLVDEGFLSRDHGVYWRTGGRVDA